MVYLIGVDHKRAQRKKRGVNLTDCQREFQSVVLSAIQSIDFSLLAEEDHPEFLSRDGADSILIDIAVAHRIESRHRFIDPNDAERESIDYQRLNGPPDVEVQNMAHEIMYQFPKREKFWLRKLQRSLDSNILFVCGWGHIESFTALLAKKRVDYYVLADKIGASQSEIEFVDEVRKYIKDHPKDFNNPHR